MLVEQLDELGKVRQRTSQPVDLVDNDDVNLAGSYVFQKSLQGRPVGVATGEAAIVVFATQEGPASVSLASDIGLRGIILGIERVKVLFKILVGRTQDKDSSSGEFAPNREISVCVRLRGGAGRTRTSNQTAIVETRVNQGSPH
jgi:hypothetical protein